MSSRMLMTAFYKRVKNCERIKWNLAEEIMVYSPMMNARRHLKMMVYSTFIDIERCVTRS